MDETEKTVNGRISKETGEGNTDSLLPKSAHRNWFFTLNNYREVDIENLKKQTGSYVFQEELSKSGTRHLQGVIIFKSARKLRLLKKINERIHWEVCKNKKLAMKYCSKLDTRNGRVFTNIKGFKVDRIIYDKFEKFEMYEWQKNIKKIIENKVDDEFR